MLSTVLSYPDRGPWGDPRYPGNFSGHLVKDLIKFYGPRVVMDPMCGSGTTGDVCRDLGVYCVQYDLNPEFGGFDVATDDFGKSADLMFLHLPYHDMYVYSGRVWGESDPRDGSRQESYVGFLAWANRVTARCLLNLYKKGRLVVVVGDVARPGHNVLSIQRDMAWPGHPERVCIKIQHNVTSDRRRYAGKLIRILHEYVLIFRRDDCWIPVRATVVKTVNLLERENVPWRVLIRSVLEDRLGGAAGLDDLYEAVRDTAKARENPHWREKVRQTVGQCPEFVRVGRARYALRKAA